MGVIIIRPTRGEVTRILRLQLDERRRGDHPPLAGKEKKKQKEVIFCLPIWEKNHKHKKGNTVSSRSCER